MARSSSNVGFDKRDEAFNNATMVDMEAYDSLPSSIRRTISSAEYNYSAEDCLNQWIEYSSALRIDQCKHSFARQFAKSLRKAYERQRLEKTPLAIAMTAYKKL